MKKRRNKFFDIRVQFFFICMAGFIGVALLAALAAWGLEHLGVNVPMFVWLLIFTRAATSAYMWRRRASFAISATALTASTLWSAS